MKTVSETFTNATKAAVKQFNYKCLIDWDGATVSSPSSTAPFHDRFVYTDEAAFCEKFTVDQKASRYPWGVVQGVATIQLSNASSRFFPGVDQTIGGYVGLPNRPCRLQVGVGSEYINLFSGFTERPKFDIVTGTWEVTALDALAVIADKISSMGGRVNMTADALISLLLQEAGLSASQFKLEPSLQDPIGYCAPNNKKILDVIADLCAAEQYLLFCDGDGLIHGWNAYHVARVFNVSWDFSFENATSMQYDTSAILNDVAVDARPYQPVGYSKIFSLTQASDDTLIPAKGTLDIWCSLTDSDNNDIYAIDVDKPIYDGQYISNFLTNVERDGSGSNNNSAILVSDMATMGPTVKVTFKNTSSTPTYITKLELFGTSAQKKFYASKRAIDRNSIAAYGTNPDQDGHSTYVIESEYVQSSAAGTQLAIRMVDGYSQPYSQARIDSFIVPQLEFGDKVRLSAGNLRSGDEMIIYGISFSASQGAKFSQTLLLDKNEQINYFVLDSSALDGGDILAP